MNATWKAALGVILVFILGWFGGVLTIIVVERHRALILLQHEPEGMAKLLERQTLRSLDLDEGKRKQVHDLIVQNLKQRMELQKQIQPQVRVINRQTLQQIDALLTPDQQQRFRESLAGFKKRFGRNPFNTGPDDQAARSGNQGNTGAGSEAPASNAPADAQ